MLLLTTLLFTLQTTNAVEYYSNATALTTIPDDDFYGMPVFYRSNTPIKQFLSKDQMRDHIQQILKPLSPFILNSERGVAERRQDGGVQFQLQPEIVQVEEYKFSFIAAAQIGDYTFR